MLLDQAMRKQVILTARPEVSVVIPSLNGRQFLPACLDSLGKYRNPEFETIVVDNGSTDGSGAHVQRCYPWVRVVRTDQNLGFAGGCNLGAAHASGEYLLFLSNDTLVTSGFLDQMLAVFKEDPTTGIVQSKMLSMETPDRVDSIGAFFTRTGILFNPGRGELDEDLGDVPREIFSAQGACMMVRADLFHQLDGFDDDFVIYFDDTDLCWRSWLSGYKVKLAPRSLVFHKGGATTSSEVPNLVVYHTFKNRLCSLIKNLSPNDMIQILPVHLVICCIGSLLFLVRRKPKSALAILGAIGWNLVKLPRTLLKRRRIAALATVDRQELFPRLARSMPLANLVKQGLSYSNQW